jgi:hypothetical protein
MVGKNAIFGLRIKLNLGPKFITGVATGTALTLAALPISKPLVFKVGSNPKPELLN